VEIEIFRVGEQSPLEIASAVQSILNDFETTLPPGVQYGIDSNRAEDYVERLSLLLENSALAAVIVLFILGLFLEYKLAFRVMMGMTISFAGGLLFLPVIGWTTPLWRGRTSTSTGSRAWTWAPRGRSQSLIQFCRFFIFARLSSASFCISVWVSLSSTISRPRRVSMMSSMVTRPLVPPNSSTTRAMCSFL
jgi:hypothetical protein